MFKKWWQRYLFMVFLVVMHAPEYAVNLKDLMPIVDFHKAEELVRTLKENPAQLLHCTQEVCKEQLSDLFHHEKHDLGDEQQSTSQDSKHLLGTLIKNARRRIDQLISPFKQLIRRKIENGYREFTKREIKRFISRAWVPAAVTGAAIIVWYLALRYSLHVHRESIKKDLIQFFSQSDLTQVLLQHKIQSY